LLRARGGIVGQNVASQSQESPRDWHLHLAVMCHDMLTHRGHVSRHRRLIGHSGLDVLSHEVARLDPNITGHVHVHHMQPATGQGHGPQRRSQELPRG